MQKEAILIKYVKQTAAQTRASLKSSIENQKVEELEETNAWTVRPGPKDHKQTKKEKGFGQNLHLLPGHPSAVELQKISTAYVICKVRG